MALHLLWWLSMVVAFLFVAVSGFYAYFTVKFYIGKKSGVPRVAASFPFGIVGNCYLEEKSFPEIMMDYYKKFEGYNYGEIFSLKFDTLVLRSPDSIRNFLSKDYSHFTGRGFHVEDRMEDPLVVNLFTMVGVPKRKMRAKITPAFSSGKMRMMFQTIMDCGLQLQECAKLFASKGEIVNFKDLIGRYAVDVIMTCAFGVESNSLKNPNSEVRVIGQKFFTNQELSYLGSQVIPKYEKTIIPPSVSAFFLTLVRETVEYREKNNVSRNDFMDLMIQLKNKGYVDDDKEGTINRSLPEDREDALQKLTVDEVASQAFVFFLAGFESSTMAISFALYELAVHQEMQTKLRQEITSVLTKHGGQVTYDAIQEMEYLDKVLSETMRKYPPLPAAFRECTTAYKLPECDAVVPEGTQVIVPILALHHDPRYYPDPERFDPERFTPEAKAARLPYTYLPFGDGPKGCIGRRFAILQSKVGLVSLLTGCEMFPCDKTSTPNAFKRRPTKTRPGHNLFLRAAEISCSA